LSVQTTISTRHGHVSGATQERITDKVEKLRKYFDRVSAIEVMVDLEHRGAVEVEVRLSVEHAPQFVASETADELFVALDAVVHKLEQQLRRHKERIQAGHRQPGRKQIEVPLEPEPEAE
jgi:putative sigma-54 modulation protein